MTTPRWLMPRATEFTSRVWPVRGAASGVSVSGSHTRTVPSLEPDTAISRPPGVGHCAFLATTMGANSD